MATIRRRNKVWQVQVRHKGFRPISKTFRSKSEAVRWARNVEVRMELAGHTGSANCGSQLVSELLETYKKTEAPKKASYKSDVSRLSRLCGRLGSLRITEITNAHLAHYRDERSSEVGPQSVRHELSILNRVFGLAEQEWGYVFPQGRPRVSMPRMPAGRTRRLNQTELSLLIQTAEKSGLIGLIVKLAIETGMRRGEILGIESAHINLEARTLYIPTTKTGVPRTIPLSKKAIEILNGQLVRSDTTLFVIRPNSVTQAFSRACRRIGLEDFRFHDLRHEATSRFFERGLNTMEVASITGHASLIMLKRYTHLRAENLLARLD